MAHVFQGKIAMPGDHMETYLETLGQFEQTKAPMRTQLEQCAKDFERALAQQYAATTGRKCTASIALFIDFVCWDTDVRRMEEMTRGIANSAFRQWYRRQVGDRTERKLKTAVKQFFLCLAQEQGITNEAVWISLQRSRSREGLRGLPFRRAFCGEPASACGGAPRVDQPLRGRPTRDMSNLQATQHSTRDSAHGQHLSI
jgi:hypothetical protein